MITRRGSISRTETCEVETAFAEFKLGIVQLYPS